MRNNQANDARAIGQAHTAHTACGAAHRAHHLLIKAYGLAVGGQQHDVVTAVCDSRAHQPVTLLQRQCDQSVRAGTGELLKRRALNGTQRCGKEDVAVFGVLTNRQQRRDALTLVKRQQINQRSAARTAAGLRQVVAFKPIHFAPIREHQQSIVGRCHAQMLNDIFIFHRRCGFAPTAATLSLIIRQRLRFGIPRSGDGHHHVLFSDQVFGAQVTAARLNFGAALIAVLLANGAQLGANHLQQTVWIF